MIFYVHCSKSPLRLVYYVLNASQIKDAPVGLLVVWVGALPGRQPRQQNPPERVLYLDRVRVGALSLPYVTSGDLMILPMSFFSYALQPP